MSLRKPLFIVFEGIDGSGKSTACAETEKALLLAGESVVRLAEPTKGMHGNRIRQLLSQPVKPDPDLMLELFIKDREEDVASNISPNLASGAVVLLDRYYFSNAAYQGASGLSFKRILSLNERFGFPKPDRVYLFDLDPKVALERISARNLDRAEENDAFEKGPFLEDVRALYRQMADESFVIVDAFRTVEETLSVILDDIRRSFTDV